MQPLSRDALVDRVIQRRLQGASFGVIAREFGCSKGTVVGICGRAGLAFQADTTEWHRPGRKPRGVAFRLVRAEEQ